MSLRVLVGNRSFLALLFGTLLVLPAFANQYTLFVGNLMLLYIILALGLNILVGFAGLLAFSNAAIYGIGAYGTALLQVHLGWSFWVAAPVGAVLAMVIGTLLAFPALRLSGIFLALATLAFAQATQWVLWHWQSVTFGAGGFRVPPPDFGWIPDQAGLRHLLRELGCHLAVAPVHLADHAVTHRSRLRRHARRRDRRAVAWHRSPDLQGDGLRAVELLCRRGGRSLLRHCSASSRRKPSISSR